MLLYQGKLILLLRKAKEDFFALLFICIVATAVPYYLKMYTLQHLESSEAMIIGSLDPFITAFYSYFIFQERLETSKIFGIITGFFSVFFLLCWNFQSLEEVRSAEYIWSVITGIAAVFIGRYGWILTKKLLDAERYSYVEINFLILVGAGICFFFTSISCAQMLRFSYLTTESWSALFDPLALFLLLYTTVASNIFFYYVYSYFIKNYPITQVSYTGLIIPLACHFFGWIFLQEELSVVFMLSFLLMVFSYGMYYYKRITGPQIEEKTLQIANN